MIPSSYRPIGSDSPPGNEENLVPEQEEGVPQQPKWRQAIQKLRNADKSFVVSKAFYFFFYTALGALFPFFSLFYKQLWLTPGQIGLLLALRPAVKLVCLPLWKMVTDRYSKPKIVYFISILGWLIGYFGQSFVYPTSIPCYGYATTVTASQLSGISAPTQNLSSVNGSAKSDSSLYTREQTQDWQLPEPLQNLDVRSYEKLSKPIGTEERLSNEFRETKMLPNAEGEAPLYARSQMNEHDANKRRVESNIKSNSKSNIQSTTDKFNPQNKDDPRFLSEEKSSEDKTSHTLSNDDGNEKSDSRGVEDDKREQNIKMDPPGQKIIHKEKDPGIKPFDISSVMVKSPKPHNDFRVQFNFWLFRTLIVIVVLTEIITTPTPMLADNAIVQALVETDSEYGKQRLFGSLGLGLAAILVAVWVSAITDCVYTDTIDYLPCFYVFEIALGATVLVSLCVKFDRPLDEERSEYGFLDGLKLFNTFNNGAFLVTLFVFGYLHSLQSSFLFWFLQDLGGTPVLFSIIILVYCLAEVVMYFLSNHVVEAIGQQGMICLASACYTARFLMYAYLKDPWLVLPMEIVQGVTYGGVWSIAAVYVNAPPEATSMVQSILHGSYWGLGMAFGAGISGVAIDYTDARSVFLFMAGVSFVLCMFHLGVDIFTKTKALEESQERKRAAKRGEVKPAKPKEEGFIGAAAAPLVPCLLYAR